MALPNSSTFSWIIRIDNLLGSVISLISNILRISVLPINHPSIKKIIKFIPKKQYYIIILLQKAPCMNIRISVAMMRRIEDTTDNVPIQMSLRLKCFSAIIRTGVLEIRKIKKMHKERGNPNILQ